MAENITSNEEIDVEFGAKPKPMEPGMVRVKTGSGDVGVMSFDKAQKLGLEIHPQDIPGEQMQVEAQPRVQQPMMQQNQGVVPASYQTPQDITDQEQVVEQPQQMPTGKIETAYKAEQGAIAQAAEAGAQDAARQAGYFTKASEEMDRIAKEREERTKAFNREQSAALTSIKEMNQKIGDFEYKDFWAEKSTGYKVAAAISMAFGAYGSAITGGPNQAMNIINQAVENDLNKQKASLEKIKNARDLQTNLYAVMLDKYKSEDAADAAMLSNMLAKVEMQVKHSTSLATSEKAKAQGIQMIAQLEQKRLIAEQTAAMEAAKYKMEQEKDLKPMFVPSLGQFATSKEGARKMNDILGEFYKVEGDIGRLNELLKKGSKFSLKDRAVANLVMTSLTGALRLDLVGPGAFTETEQKMIREVIGNPTKLFSLDSTTKAKLDALLERSKDTVRSIGEAEGIDTSNFDKINTERKKNRQPRINFKRL